jgi:hypothetical protein
VAVRHNFSWCGRAGCTVPQLTTAPAHRTTRR